MLPSIEEQTDTLTSWLNGIGISPSRPDERFARQPLPPGAVGHFVVPKSGIFRTSYAEATRKMLSLAEKKCRSQGEELRIVKDLDENFRQAPWTTYMMRQINAAQQTDLLIIPGQLGSLYPSLKSGSVLESTGTWPAQKAFGMRTLDLATLLLTIPHLLDKNGEHFVGAGDLLGPVIGDNPVAPFVPYLKRKVEKSDGQETKLVFFGGVIISSRYPDCRLGNWFLPPSLHEDHTPAAI